MPVKVHIDYNRCTGHGFCEGIAEDVFEVGQDGWARLLLDEVGDDRADEVEQAVADCPTRAISTS